MGLCLANETLRRFAFGPAMLFFCVACVALGCPADARGQPDSETPDESQASKPPESPPPESPAEAEPVAAPPKPNTDANKWGATARDLPQNLGFERQQWGSQIRSMGYTALEVLIVALIAVPVAVLGVFALRLLARWRESRKTNRKAAAQSQWNRRECQTWRHEVRSWRSMQKHK